MRTRCRTAICQVPRPVFVLRRFDAARLRVVVFFVTVADFAMRFDAADFFDAAARVFC